MSDILRKLARDPASGAEIFMTAPPHILAALIDEDLAAVDMSRGRPAMKITEKGREEVKKHKKDRAFPACRVAAGVLKTQKERSRKCKTNPSKKP